MIDQHFQDAIAQVSKRKKLSDRWWPYLLATFLVVCLIGQIVGPIYLLPTKENRLTDEEMVKLAVLASCSTGQSPSVEWTRANDNVSFVEWISGRGQMAKIQYFLSVLDPERCFSRQASGPQNNKWV